MSGFTHLRTHTEFSIKKSINTISEIIAKAEESNMQSLAITDLNAMFGVIKFSKEAVSKNIKPIIGCELTIEESIIISNSVISDLILIEDNENSNTEQAKIEEPKEDKKYFNIILLAKDNIGYGYISQLLSRAQIENNHKGISAVKKEWIEDNSLNSHVVMLSGAKYGDVGQAILSGDMSLAKEKATYWLNQFKDYYIELQRDASEHESIYMQGALEVCSELSISPVATHPNLFINQEDFFAHEIKTCIDLGVEVYDRKREHLYNKEQYFKTTEEMEELFSDLPIALANSNEIVKKCNFSFVSNSAQLPVVDVPAGKTIDSYFKEEVLNGLRARLYQEYPDKNEFEIHKDEYIDRIKMEVNTILKMGFPGYFLIVADVVKWCQKNDIAVGPGRGSAAGSLVAYALGVTNIDPIKHQLLFERFLNPERVSMPDIDTDISANDRPKVLKYLQEKYGEEKVAQIVTFGTLATKAVIKDVGRVLGYPYSFNDGLSKMINIPLNKPMTLSEYIEVDERLRERIDTEPQVKKLIDIAKRLQGLVRNTGVGAAGVVISPTKLTDFTPLHKKDDTSAVVSQFEISDIESTGLIKFDFLGLKNLDIVFESLKLIHEKAPDFDINAVSLNDKVVYDNIFSQGNTVGVFQFESSLMQGLLKKSNQPKFENLVMVTSIGRPGPLDYVDQWLERLHGREAVGYPHEKMEQLLHPTQGIMIYQEQVMQTAQIIAGYSLGQADLLRRAMGKKKIEEMVKQRANFVEGAKKYNDIDEFKANEIFDTMEKFAGYGFNKSHAAAYAVTSYQTAYLKNYYPTEFYAATLNNVLDDTDNISKFLTDMKQNNVQVLPPDINKSIHTFYIEEDNQIRYGLGALKGVAESATNLILAAREEKGEFTDLYDFLEKVGKGMRKNVLQFLVQAGAFDSLHSNRAQLFESIPEALVYLTNYVKKQQLNEGPLEEMHVLQGAKRKKKETTELIKPTLKEIEPWNNIAKLSYEKNAMGFYFSENPYVSYAEKVDGLKACTPLDMIEEKYNNLVKQVFVSGIIQDVNWWKSKKGGFIKITNGEMSQDVMFYSSTYDMYKEFIKAEQFVTFNAKLDNHFSGQGFGLFAEEIFDIHGTRALFIEKVYVAAENEDSVESFMNIVEQFKSDTALDQIPVILTVFDEQTQRRNKIVKEINVSYSTKMIDELELVFGKKWVKEKFLDKLELKVVKKGGFDKKKKNLLAV
jgi:DNA polymerase III subunit alpha